MSTVLKNIDQFILSKSRSIAFIIALFACLLYANTWTHDYAQDDAIVIYQNQNTTEGISGIPDLLRYDTFRGFFKEAGKSNLVSGGRYRPLTPVMFALEWEFFGRNPMLSHILNSILYGILLLVIFKALSLLFQTRNQEGLGVVILCTCLIFAAHPIHTEVVANIKGRDEIMAMLASMISLYYFVKWTDHRRKKHIILSSIALFFGLLSKENTVSFLGIIPLSIIFFRKKSFFESIKMIWPLVLAFTLFLGLRMAVLGTGISDPPQELMNNPFLKFDGNEYIPFTFLEKSATIVFILGKYIQLCFFPLHLTHDYYPRHIEIMTWADMDVWMSMIMYLMLIGLAFAGWAKRSLYSYGILFFLISLVIYSNIIFPIGTNMSERFLFMPSLGFAIIVGYLVYCAHFFTKKIKIIWTLLALYIIALSAKTVTRNQVWKNDETLFLSDRYTSPNSAKLANAVGGTLIEKANKTQDNTQKESILNEAIQSLDRAIHIHPQYKNAFLLKANAYHYLLDYEKADKTYTLALQLDPNYQEANQNQAINNREWGKHYGQNLNDVNSALSKLEKTMPLLQEDYEANRLLGIAYGMTDNQSQALKYFLKCVSLQPNIAINYVYIARAYESLGNFEQHQAYLQKAKQIDPNVLQ